MAEGIERAFMPYQRLESSRNRETGGTGLGLTIARDIIRGHGGEIKLGGRDVFDVILEGSWLCRLVELVR